MCECSAYLFVCVSLVCSACAIKTSDALEVELLMVGCVCSILNLGPLREQWGL